MPAHPTLTRRKTSCCFCPARASRVLPVSRFIFQRVIYTRENQPPFVPSLSIEFSWRILQPRCLLSLEQSTLPVINREGETNGPSIANTRELITAVLDTGRRLGFSDSSEAFFHRKARSDYARSVEWIIDQRSFVSCRNDTRLDRVPMKITERIRLTIEFS